MKTVTYDPDLLLRLPGPAPKPVDMVEAAKALIRGLKFNENHEPAGTPEGGRYRATCSDTHAAVFAATLDRMGALKVIERPHNDPEPGCCDERAGEKHYPGGQDHDQDDHGNWATGATAGGTGGTIIETVPPQQWHDDWRREFIAMMKGFGATDEMAEKFAGDVVILPSSAVRLREPGRQVYVVDRTGNASDEDMRRVGRYAMEAMRRDPQEHLSRGRDKSHLQISIVDTISVKDGPGVLGASGYHGQDIEFKPRALTLVRGNKGEWMPAADEGDILRYLVAHEYGHIRATETYGMQKAAILPKFARASKYALTSPHEAYAEGYAQWVIDKSVVPELAKVAKAEGWPGAD